MKNKLLITGGSGLLGSHIVREAADQFEVSAISNNHKVELRGCKCFQVSITDREKLAAFVKDTRPDIVIHTAALKSVDYCKNHVDEAQAVNVGGAENVALAARQAGARLVFISSDSVFDGRQGGYTEADITNPQTVYGRTKLEAEKRLQSILPESLIIRPNSIFGWSLYGQSIAEWILAELKQGKTLKMFSDSFFNPILANNLARAVLEMVQKDLHSIYHVAGGEKSSRFDLAREIALAFGFNQSLVVPASINEGDFKRPGDSSLSIAKAQKVLSTPLLGLKDSVAWFKKLRDRGDE